LDSCAETGGEAAPMCACDFLLEKREYYVHIKKCIHLLFNFSLRHFSISVLSEAVYEKKFLWKKASLFSPKHCQNGKNSMADNLTLTDPNGKVRRYSGSSWLKLSYHIGVYMVSTESWNQLVTEFLNPLYLLEWMIQKDKTKPSRGFPEVAEQFLVWIVCKNLKACFEG
jgi:hypothetical protein